NYGKAAQAARIINEARARGVNVMAAQHPYTATQSSLSAYTIPRWASVGGQAAMRRRFEHPDTARMLDVQTLEMLDIRGGAEKILFVDRRPELNGKTLAQVAQGLGLPVPAAVRRVLAGGNASVMNLDLYDLENAKYLAQQDWMMTCTDGRTPPPGAEIVHPRPYGAFTRKLRLFALEDPVITLPFAVRGMTSLAWTFLGVPDRGLIKPGFYADIAVFDVARIRDRATYEEPHRAAPVLGGHGSRAGERPVRVPGRQAHGGLGRAADPPGRKDAATTLVVRYSGNARNKTVRDRSQNRLSVHPRLGPGVRGCGGESQGDRLTTRT
ncbi:MAG: amidohydrolase family protein, partial [Gemmatimonadetes bacterium]|nr:amidohydrolase family protein [Gemmatimonadota bacterium]